VTQIQTECGGSFIVDDDYADLFSREKWYIERGQPVKKFKRPDGSEGHYPAVLLVSKRAFGRAPDRGYEYCHFVNRDKTDLRAENIEIRTNTKNANL
jgi:hypothetical protein